MSDVEKELKICDELLGHCTPNAAAKLPSPTSPRSTTPNILSSPIISRASSPDCCSKATSSAPTARVEELAGERIRRSASLSPEEPAAEKRARHLMSPDSPLLSPTESPKKKQARFKHGSSTFNSVPPSPSVESPFASHCQTPTTPPPSPPTKSSKRKSDASPSPEDSQDSESDFDPIYRVAEKKIAEIPKEFEMELPYSFISEHYNSEINKMKKGWTKILNSHFEKQNPVCVLSFHGYKICKKKRSAHSFRAKARCKLNGCKCDYKFSLASNLDDKSSQNVKITVTRIGPIIHEHAEAARRFVTGEDRSNLAEKVSKSSATLVELENLNKIHEDESKTVGFVKGNLNHAPNRMLLHKMKSELIAKDDLDKEPYTHMRLLREKLSEKKELVGKTLKGYIQRDTTFPISVSLYTERQIKYLLHLLKKEEVFLYFDATGSLVAKPIGTNKRVYYYALVLKGTDESSPLPVAEFITNEHTAVEIRLSLIDFIAKVRKVGKRKFKIAKIETDFSLALIQSILTSFNSLETDEYLKEAWKVFDEEMTSKEFGEKYTVAHVCCAHILKTGIKNAREMSRGKPKDIKKKLHIFSARAMALLLETKNRSEAQEIFTGIVMAFNSPRINEEVKMAIKNIFKLKDVSGTEESKENGETEEKCEIITDTDKHLRHGSPFYGFFNNIKKKVTLCADETLPVNDCYFPEFIDYLIEYILPFFPLWSGVVLQHFGIVRDSNNIVENWFKIVKNLIFLNQTGILLPRFIRKLSDYVISRLITRLYSRKTSKQKENDKKKKEQRKENNEKKEQQQENNEKKEQQKENNEKKQQKQQQEKTAKNSKKSTKKNQREAKPKCSGSDIDELDNVEEGWDRGKKKGASENFHLTKPKLISERNARKRSISPEEPESKKKCKAEKRDEAGSSSSETSDEETSNGPTKTSGENATPEPHSPTQGRAARPWDSIEYYPEKMVTMSDEDKIVVCGVPVQKSSIDTLTPNAKIEGDVINAFAQLSQSLNKNETKKIAVLDTFFVGMLTKSRTQQEIANNVFFNYTGFFRWAFFKKLWTFKCWIMPLHTEIPKHWAFILVNFLDMTIVYIDSCHFNPPVEVYRAMKFIEKLMASRNITINWTDWRFYAPKDVPEQDTDDCGAHLCTWINITLSQRYIQFEAADGTGIRKWIASLLFSNDGLTDRRLKKDNKGLTEFLNFMLNKVELSDEFIFDFDKAHKDIGNISWSNQPPSNSGSTLNYCSSLVTRLTYGNLFH